MVENFFLFFYCIGKYIENRDSFFLINVGIGNVYVIFEVFFVFFGYFLVICLSVSNL